MKYLGFPLPKLETIYPILAKGCRKIRDAEFFEDIRYTIDPTTLCSNSSLNGSSDCFQGIFVEPSFIKMDYT